MPDLIDLTDIVILIVALIVLIWTERPPAPKAKHVKQPARIR